MNGPHLFHSALAAGLACLILAGTSLAAIPPTLEVRGELGRNPTGRGPGLEKQANMRLTLLDATGAPVHVEEHCAVRTVGRYAEFELCLGMEVPLDVRFDGPMATRVEACFDKDGCDGVVDVDECDPRYFREVLVPAKPVAFAHAAGDADTLDGLDSLDFLQTLSFAHPMLSISEGNAVDLESLANDALAYDNASRSLLLTDGSGTLSTSLADLSQTLSRSGDELSLSNEGGTVSVADDDADPANELQTVSRSGDDVTLSDGGGSFDVRDDDANPTNELQTLARSGDELTLSDGGGTVSVADDDADPANELQTVSRSGDDVTLSDGGGTFDVRDDDADPANELQTVSRSGDDVTLSDGGGTFDVRDDDADPANELQTVSRSGDDITLSDGGGTFDVRDDDANPTNELQTLSVSGTSLTISNGNTVSVPGDDLGNHRATQRLDMADHDIESARTGEFGSLGRYASVALSSRVSALDGDIGIAIWGENFGNSGGEIGVYGASASPEGWGVYASGRLGTSGRLVIGDAPDDPRALPEVLTIDADGNVLKSRREAQFVTFDMTVEAPFGLTYGWLSHGFNCPGNQTVRGGGAIDIGTPDFDADCFIQSSGPLDRNTHETRVVCGPTIREFPAGPPVPGLPPPDPPGQRYRWTMSCGSP